MIERDDVEMLADAIDRVMRRLESGELIDPTDDIPHPPAQASRLRALLPTIRDLIDLGRSHAAAPAARRLAEEFQKPSGPRPDSRGADPVPLMTESTADA